MAQVRRSASRRFVDLTLQSESKPGRLSDILRDLDARTGLQIGELTDELGHRGFGALMFLFAVPNVIPTPPGTSAILGAPLLLLTYQLMIGRKAIWLPRAIRQKTLDPSAVSAIVKRVLPFVIRFERILKPRLLMLTTAAAERMVGFVALVLAIILFLPIPFGNILPAAAISVLALGLAERDGLAICLGLLLAVLSLAVLGLVWSAIYAAILTFFTVLFGG